MRSSSTADRASHVGVRISVRVSPYGGPGGQWYCECRLFGGWYGRYLSADSRSLVRDHPRPRLGAASLGGCVMSIMYWLAGLLALFLFGYLLYALVKAETILMSATTQFVLLLAAFLGILLLLAKPLGSYMADVMEGRAQLRRCARARRLEGLLYRLCGIDAGEEMSWTQYAIALLLFNVLGAVGRLRPAAPAVLVAAQPAEARGGQRRTRRSTRPSASSPTRTGRAIRANRRWAISCRWRASRCRISCRRRPASRSRSR